MKSKAGRGQIAGLGCCCRRRCDSLRLQSPSDYLHSHDGTIQLAEIHIQLEHIRTACRWPTSLESERRSRASLKAGRASGKRPSFASVTARIRLKLKQYAHVIV